MNNEKYKYTGKEKDATGLYYFGARYYDPAIGRFITRDPIKGNIMNPQMFNPYVYCLNNPLKYIDPDGRERIDIYDVGEAVCIIGAIILGILSLNPALTSYGVAGALGATGGTVATGYLNKENSQRNDKLIKKVKKRLNKHGYEHSYDYKDIDIDEVWGESGDIDHYIATTELKDGSFIELKFTHSFWYGWHIFDINHIPSPSSGFGPEDDEDVYSGRSGFNPSSDNGGNGSLPGGDENNIIPI